MTEPDAGPRTHARGRGHNEADVEVLDLDAIDPEADPSSHPPAQSLAGVAIGAAAGATARFVMYQVLPSGPPGFPLATFAVNLTGSFLLGVTMGALQRYQAGHRVRSLVAAGVLGTYTTFSTFIVDAALLLHGGRWGLAAAYVGASVAGGLGAAWTGLRTGRIPGRPGKPA